MCRLTADIDVSEFSSPLYRAELDDGSPNITYSDGKSRYKELRQ
jgi:hypothetical protein